jgi:hypothetical protein
MADCTDRLNYYNQKCQKHLSRVRLSHALALEGLRRNGLFSGGSVNQLISTSFANGLDKETDKPKLEKLDEVIHELHLMALKANFELYLNRLLTTLWTFHFSQLVPTISGHKKISLVELASEVAEHANEFSAKEFVIDQIVARHGLLPFTDAIEKATGISLKQVLDKNDFHYWPQIQMAFEVRHLVEHCDGKVDGDFREHVAESWPNTTWGRRGNNLQRMEKIEVENEDIVITYNTMLDAARLMTEAVIDWASKNQTLDTNAKTSDAS